MARKFLVKIIQWFLPLITTVEYVGFEKLKFEGTTLFTANHLGRLDAILIMGRKEFGAYPNLVIVVAEKYEESFFWGWWSKKLDFIFMDRFNPDIRALREVLRRLSNDGIMVIAPEGTRSPTESLIEGKQGAAYVAAKSGATVYPASLIGSEDRVAKARLKKFKKIIITVRLGEPYKIPPLPSKDKAEFLKMWTDEIMCQIAALLPAKYRGIYANHPRTVELLKKEG